MLCLFRELSCRYVRFPRAHVTPLTPRAEHDLVELFTRRAFKCDCPTAPGRCTLLRPTQPPTHNTYTKNFAGEFCRCERGKRYDPMEEAESMLECLGCEDWFHESCLVRPSHPRSTPLTLPQNLQDPRNPIPVSDAQSTTSTTSTSTVESPLLPSSAYAHLLCAQCILRHPLLRQYAGTPGWMMIVPATTGDVSPLWAEQWQVIGRDEPHPGHKRTHPPDEEDSLLSAKRIKLSPSTSSDPPRTRRCTLPPPNPVAQRILHAAEETQHPKSTARGDVFLLPNARESICTCESVRPALPPTSLTR